ncbi:MAG TPA: TonB-dependent receptor [Candidatus Angelobacter sp.]|nr:TonB-dependent receptor [Candidatus Angelobacter sp.]
MSMKSNPRSGRIVRLAALLLGVVTIARLGAAQTLVTGHVYQADGKTEIPGAIVTLKNPSIGLLRKETTDEDGEYTFQQVPPASGYDVEASLNDKVLSRRLAITVLVGQAKVVLPSLIQDQIETVKAETPKGAELNFSPTSSENITREQLQSLPLFNRTFLALGLLSPGSHDTPAGSPLAGATFSIAGARPTSNNFLLDGTDNVASSTNQAIPFQVNDSIQEFRVIYSTPSAEYGRGQGGVVDVVTRRANFGGNGRWHGSAFGFLSNDALNSDSPLSVYTNTTFEQALLRANPSNFDANPTGAFTVTTNAKTGQKLSSFAPKSYNALVGVLGNLGATGCMACGKPFDVNGLLAANDSHTQRLQQEQFGFSTGGPIGSKLLLFSSYEGTIINNPNPIFERVPTTFDKSFSDSPGLIDNQSAQLAQNILRLYPQSNVVAVPGVLEFFKGQAPNFTHVHNLLFRADYVATEHTTWLLRYSGQLLNQLHDDSLPANSLYAGNGSLRNAQNQSFTVNQVYNSPHGWVNDGRISFTQFRLDETPQDRHFDATSIGLPTQLMPSFVLSGIDPRALGATPTTPGAAGGWFDSFWNASGATAPSPITPSLDGLFPFARIGSPLSSPEERRDGQFLVADNLGFHSGRHQIKIGAEAHYFQNILSDGGIARGLVVSNNIGEFTHDSETCISCGSAFTNPSFDYAIRQPNRYSGDLRSWTISGFIEDTFNLRRNLTVNAGVRYDFFAQPWETHNLLWNFNPAANGLVQENGSQVVDPFGFICGAGEQPKLNSVFSAAALTNPWTCSPKGASLPGQKYTNIAPRIGFAYAPFDQKTVIRGGVGVFYDQQPASSIGQLLQNRPSPLNVANPSAIYGQNFSSNQCNQSQCGLGNISLNPANTNPTAFANFQAASGPPSISALDLSNNSTPFTLQFNGSVQQQLGHFTAQVGYVGALGYKLPVLHNANFQDEFFCTNSSRGASGNCDNLSYFPIFTLSNVGGSSYHSFVVKIQGQSWRGLRVNGTYTYSHSYDNASSSQFPQVASTLWNQLFGLQLNGVGSPFAFVLSGNGVVINAINGGSLKGSASSFTVPDNQGVNSALVTTGARTVITSQYLIPQDPVNFLKNDYGRSDFDAPHRLVLDFTYDLPFSQKSKLAGGWQVSGITVAESGQPFTVFSGAAFGEITQRANVQPSLTGNPNAFFGTGGLSLPGADQATCSGVYASPGALFNGQPGGACVGNSQRNQFRGPIYSTTDLAIQKKFMLRGDDKSVSLRAEFFNLLNLTNFYNPVSTLSTDGFTFNPAFGRVLSAHDPRQIQLGARFDF